MPLNLLLAFLLLWRDTWFPPLLETLAFVQQQGLPSTDYMINFAMRSVKGWMIGLMVGLYVATAIANNFFRMTTLSIVGILAIMGNDYYHRPNRMELDAVYDSFRDSETTRSVYLSRVTDPNEISIIGRDQIPPAEALEGEDFDIIFLHICSLSWADIRLVMPEGSSFFQQFDFLFTNFNTVTSYSGPAMIRLLRAPCGQAPHIELYEEARSDCLLIPSLERVGYTVDVAFNHDGHYGEFATQLADLGGGGESTPIPIDDLLAPLTMFDGSLIYGDASVLNRWWEGRAGKSDGPHALYYNSVTLHDGVMKAGGGARTTQDAPKLYRELLQHMFDDFTRFFDTLSATKRNFVVVFVPEHGRALTGSPLQPAAIREVPMPDITLAPVGVKFIGPRFQENPFNQVIVEKPTSFLSLAYMIDAFLKKNPFVYEGYGSRIFLDDIPITDFVSENQGVTIIKNHNDYYHRGKGKTWVKLPTY